MKRIFTIFTTLILAAAAAHAQTSFSIQAGVINSNWKGEALNSLNNVVQATNGIVSTTSKTGVTAGVYAAVPVGNSISIVPGIAYSQKGYVMQGDLKIDALKFLGANASAKVAAYYIDVPLLVKARLTKGLSIYAGPQLSYLVKNNLKATAGVLGISLYNSTLDITDQFNRLDLGLTGGVGYQFENGLNVKAGYDYGLSRLDKNENFKAYNRALKLTVGFAF